MYANRKNLAALFGVTTQTVYRRVKGIEALIGERYNQYVDNVISMDDEVLGSTYFLAPPGETTVQIHCSEFSTPEPTVKAYIREAFI